MYTLCILYFICLIMVYILAYMGVTVCCITYNIIYNENGWILYGCRIRVRVVYKLRAHGWNP